MKPNAAAAALDPSVRRSPRRFASIVLSMILFLCAGSAMALDGIDLSVPAEPTAEGECPRLIQIKYPFLSCADGQIGMAEADDSWAESRRIPIGGAWTEGPGYWGWTLNDPIWSEF